MGAALGPPPHSSHPKTDMEGSSTQSRTHQKMERQGPFLVQKARRKCLIVIYMKLFPFLGGLSTCHDVFVFAI